MRTTLSVDDELLSRAKAYAASHHRTLTSVVEEGIRNVLDRSERQRSRKRVTLPTSTAGGGVLPGVDLDDSAALLDIMDDDAAR
ncbi:MAG: DUF6364 family protein [Micromonosporaceae bacterium]